MAVSLYLKKCAKCNITAEEDKNLSFHRFPLPGKQGLKRVRIWAQYCYPTEDWSTEKSLIDLYSQHKMICSKHFDISAYTTLDRTRLNKLAVPTGAQDLLFDCDDIEQPMKKAKCDNNILVNNPELSDIMAHNSNLADHHGLKEIKKESLEPKMEISETDCKSTKMSCEETIMELKTKVSTAQARTPKCIDEVQKKWNSVTPSSNSVGTSRGHKSWAKNSSEETEDADDPNEGEDDGMGRLPDVDIKVECVEESDLATEQNCPEKSYEVPLRQMTFEDEFDHFGKNVAEQLRTLPLKTALETQEMLLSVLKKQRLKVLDS